MIVFRTPPYGGPGAGVFIPDYSLLADELCNYLSLLFGKRVDCHGLIEGSGFFGLPDLTLMSTVCEPTLPQNSRKPRADFSTELDFVQCARIQSLFEFRHVDSHFFSFFRTATKFYAQAHRVWERDAETAYLNLVTAGEVLSNFYKFDKTDLLDEDLKELIKTVQQCVPNGDEIAGKLIKKWLGIKKRFVKAIVDLVTPEFFECTESTTDHEKFRSNDFESSIKAAYDLRSKHLHTGKAFGFWVSRRTNGSNEEVQAGRPDESDKEFAKVLERAPTLVGLERIIRFCLLKFAERNGAYHFPENALESLVTVPPLDT
jgi:hypothetical protein